MKNKTQNVFFNRNFRLVFLGALVSELGALMFSFAVSFYILKISNNNPVLQGVYLALCGVAMLISTPVGGVLGDRFNKVKIMYLCDYAKGGLIVLTAALMLLLPGSKAQIAILFVEGILGSIISGIFSPAAEALPPHILNDEKLQQANSYIFLKSSMESILGVVLAGILYAALPICTLFFCVGGCYILSGVSEMFIRYEHVPAQNSLTVKNALNDMKEGFIYVKTQPAILALLVSILFVNLFVAPMTSNFMPYFVSTDFNGRYLFDKLLTPELWSSVIEVFLALGSLVGAAILSGAEQQDKCGPALTRRLCVTAGILLCMALAYWLLVGLNGLLNVFLPLFCAGSILFGFMLSYVNVPVSTMLMRVVDKDKLSKVSSIMSVGSQGMTPLSSVLAGIVLGAAGSSVLLISCALGFAAVALIMLFNKSIKEL